MKNLKQLAADLKAETFINGSAESLDAFLEQKPLRLMTLSEATASDISFLANSRYAHELSKTKAMAVILDKENLSLCQPSCLALVVSNPYLSFAKVARLFDTTPKLPEGIHPTAVIHPSVTLGPKVAIGPYVEIRAGAVIGEAVQIYSHSVIGENVHIGRESILYPHVVIYHGVRMGERCIIHSTSVIGSDGFGLAPDPSNPKQFWMKIPQLGSVKIGDDVEIGASTTIDRGALSDTVIDSGAKLDNQIQIGHNVQIGAHTAMAGGTMVAGSSKIGKHCLIGGQSAINGHLTITDRVTLAGGSAVASDLTESGETYASSIKAQPKIKWFRTLANLNRLDKLSARLRQLEKSCEAFLSIKK